MTVKARPPEKSAVPAVGKARGSKTARTISSLIEKAIKNHDVRYPNPHLLKCWEVKKCGQTRCPSYKNTNNLRCWQVAGTYCGGKVQGAFAKKHGNCRKCEVFKAACADETSMVGEEFNNLMYLLQLEKEKVSFLNKELLGLLDGLEKQHSQIQELTITDSLTGAYNRHYLFKILNQEIERSAAYKRPLSFVLLDVDEFKKYNDSFGHLSGDVLLQEITARIKDSVRATDFVFRFGGDEIVVLLPETELTLALVVAERIRRKIGAEPFYPQEQDKSKKRAKGVNKTVSVGVVALASPDSTPQDLFDQADQAMYSAKKRGGDCVVCPAIS